MRYPRAGVLAVMLQLVAAVTASAADPPPHPRDVDRFGAVRSWTLSGTVRAEGNEFAYRKKYADATFYFRQSRNNSVSARIELTEFRQGPAFFEWRGKGEARYDVADDDALDIPTQFGRSRHVGAGSHGTEARLVIDRLTGKYLFRIGHQSVNGTLHTESHLKDPRADALVNKRPRAEQPMEVSAGVECYFDVWHDVPDRAMTLAGDTSLPVAEFKALHPQLTAEEFQIAYPTEGSLTWSLVPEGYEKLELLIEPQADYKTWLPEGDLLNPDLPRAKLGFALRLVSDDGKPVRSKLNTFYVELEKTSAEPGVCLNWPPAGAHGKALPDLRIGYEPAGKLVPVNEAAQIAVGAPMGGTSVSSFVWCFDYGAFANLKAHVVLDDGRIIYGHLVNEPALTRVPIPWRTGGSRIAEVWKERNDAVGLADDDDSEDTPVGDGSRGDGLSLYEEYRGLRTEAGYLRTKPRERELFVRDELRDGTGPAFDAFTALTGIRVTRVGANGHEARVVNFNHASAHRVDQHLIVVSRGSRAEDMVHFGAGGICHAQRDAAGRITPKDVTRVAIFTTPGTVVPTFAGGVDAPGTSADFHTITIVHELLHAINAKHHGESDMQPATWTAAPDGKGVLEGGKAVRVLTESKAPNPYSYYDLGSAPAGLTLRVATQGGLYSGDQGCIMRYAGPLAYRYPSNTSDRRIWIAIEAPEGWGTGLCTAPKGTGVNAAGRAPWPRCGDATLGDCFHQLHLSDAPQ